MLPWYTRTDFIWVLAPPPNHSSSVERPHLRSNYWSYKTYITASRKSETCCDSKRPDSKPDREAEESRDREMEVPETFPETSRLVFVRRRLVRRQTGIAFISHADKLENDKIVKWKFPPLIQLITLTSLNDICAASFIYKLYKPLSEIMFIYWPSSKIISHPGTKYNKPSIRRWQSNFFHSDISVLFLGSSIFRMVISVRTSGCYQTG